MKVLIYGLGRSGVPAAALAARQGHEVFFYDAAPKAEDVAALEALGCQQTLEPLSVAAESCVAAPGVPYDHPDLQALRDRGVETIGEVEWVQRSCPGKLIGITGTAGKTSVTRWLTLALQNAGISALAGGNIGPALSAVAGQAEWLVCELSSFQLERCPTLKPDIVILLNLGEDHLDRHGSVAAYHQAKLSLLRHLDEKSILVYNLDDPALRRAAEDSVARGKSFSLEHKSDAYFDEAADMLYLDGLPLIATKDLQVSGRHQISNALAVALAAQALELGNETIREGLMAFGGEPGRYSVAGRLGAVTFIEDSIATRALAVKAALEATPPPIVWIAGGADKGARLAPLAPLIEARVSLLIGVGQSGARLAQEASAYTRAQTCPEENGEAALRCACAKGLEHLQKHHPEGGTVLLAPLAASFDQFKDYKERAGSFRKVVREMEAMWTAS